MPLREVADTGAAGAACASGVVAALGALGEARAAGVFGTTGGCVCVCSQGCCCCCCDCDRELAPSRAEDGGEDARGARARAPKADEPAVGVTPAGGCCG